VTRWYVSTAGVRHDDDYRWLALADGDATVPQDVLYERLGGSNLGDLISDSELNPSVVLWRRSDGSFAVYVDGLLHPDAPAKGDYHGRTIRTTLMGISADPAPLLAAAAVALAGDLAPTVPVRWVASSPKVAAGADRWSPPEPRPTGDPTGLPGGLRESWGLPWAQGPAVARDLAGLDAQSLRSYPKGRILLFSTKLIGVAQLEQLRPWRALTPSLNRPREFKEGKTEPGGTGRRHRVAGRVVIPIAVGVPVVVVAVWAFAGPTAPAPSRTVPPTISTTPSPGHTAERTTAPPSRPPASRRPTGTSTAKAPGSTKSPKPTNTGKPR